MKKAIFEGLTKRPTYEEIAGVVNKPFITSFPDRKAYKLRNSNWLSQLDGENHKFLEQMHENMKKDHASKQVIQEHARASGMTFSNTEAVSAARPLIHYHVPTDSADVFHDADSEDDNNNISSQITHIRHNKSHLSEVITNKRYPVPHVPQVFSIATPDFDQQVEQERDDIIMKELMIMDDVKTKRSKSLRKAEESLAELQRALEIPSLRLRQHGGSSSSGLQREPEAWVDESMNRPHSPRPQAKQKTKHDKKDEPEKTEPTKEAKKRSTKKDREPESTSKPVKKDKITKPKHETEKSSFDTFDEWKKRGGGKGFLIDQIDKRGHKFKNKTELKKTTINDMINLLLTLDGKKK